MNVKFESKSFERGFGSFVSTCRIVETENGFILEENEKNKPETLTAKEVKIIKRFENGYTIAQDESNKHYEFVGYDANGNKPEHFGYCSELDKVNQLNNGEFACQYTWWQSRGGFDDASETIWFKVDKNGELEDYESREDYLSAVRESSFTK